MTTGPSDPRLEGILTAFRHWRRHWRDNDTAVSAERICASRFYRIGMAAADPLGGPELEDARAYLESELILEGWDARHVRSFLDNGIHLAVGKIRRDFNAPRPPST